MAVEVESANGEPRVRCWRLLTARVIGICAELKKIAHDDPRRLMHSFKVGLALTVVSTVYYVTPLFNGFGDSAMWAVSTVALVTEFTVGGTLTKGLNRAFATLLASALGVGAHHLAVQFGEKGEPVVLGFLVFLIAVSATFARFIPELKAKFDYGMMVFIMTFCIVGMSSYRKEKLLVLAYHRMSTIAIGVAVALLIFILVFPVWAGDDLHKQVAANLDKLAEFMEGLESEYFGEKLGGKSLEAMAFLEAYTSVLNSKSIEESLAASARWEPGHGRFGFYHPWDQYLKIGAQSRRCAYFMEVLNAYITKRETQAPTETEFLRKVQAACKELSSESSKELRELASSIRSMVAPSAAKRHLVAACKAADQLSTSLQDSCVLSEILQAAAIASLLGEIVECSRHIVASVEKLAQLARFESSETFEKSTAIQLANKQGSHVSIMIVG